MCLTLSLKLVALEDGIVAPGNETTRKAGHKELVIHFQSASRRKVLSRINGMPLGLQAASCKVDVVQRNGWGPYRDVSLACSHAAEEIEEVATTCQCSSRAARMPHFG